MSAECQLGLNDCLVMVTMVTRPPTLVGVPGLRNKDLEEPVANNSTIYAINAVVLATFAGLAAYNPGLVSALSQGFC